MVSSLIPALLSDESNQEQTIPVDGFVSCFNKHCLNHRGCKTQSPDTESLRSPIHVVEMSTKRRVHLTFSDLPQAEIFLTKGFDQARLD